MENEIEKINALYNEIIKKCKFISKENSWFIESKECILVDKIGFQIYANENTKFNQNYGLFDGLTMETFDGYSGNLPREDTEVCDFSEFLIYDEFENEISQLTLKEYNQLTNQ
jgi:hypothetical protein